MPKSDEPYGNVSCSICFQKSVQLIACCRWPLLQLSIYVKTVSTKQERPGGRRTPRFDVDLNSDPAEH